MALETPEPVARLVVSVHLDTGRRLEFEADSIQTSRSPMDGRITKLSWEGATTATGSPLFLDLDHVVAVLVTQVER